MIKNSEKKKFTQNDYRSIEENLNCFICFYTHPIGFITPRQCEILCAFYRRLQSQEFFCTHLYNIIFAMIPTAKTRELVSILFNHITTIYYMSDNSYFIF
ncbi:hypothetical protein BpHYR1_002533 [Brachionus plicatilis]|uniref:Uncharacterized protein n=1 Tax=Brachionus plicatilis TaxID=10195 RepID=A0A3M7SR49_BRAPC|nr:hypothetical protein BpHYR1_002533 [Brachionus plicatilis]